MHIHYLHKVLLVVASLLDKVVDMDPIQDRASQCVIVE